MQQNYQSYESLQNTNNSLDINPYIKYHRPKTMNTNEQSSEKKSFNGTSISSNTKTKENDSYNNFISRIKLNYNLQHPRQRIQTIILHSNLDKSLNMSNTSIQDLKSNDISSNNDDNLNTGFILDNSGSYINNHNRRRTINHLNRVYDERLQKGEEAISADAMGEHGTVAMTATVTALDEFLFACLDAFHAHYPKIRFRISSVSSNASIDKLRSGAVDVAFITSPYQSYSDITTQTLMNFPNVVIAGKGMTALKEGTHTLEELSDYEFVSLPQSMQLRQYEQHVFREASLSPNTVAEVDSASTVIPMVSHNLGLGIVPYSLAKNAIEAGEVFVVKLAKPLPLRQVVMAIRSEERLTSAALLFTKFAARLAKDREAKAH